MSEKSIAQKLLIKSNYKILIINEPLGYRQLLGNLPVGISIVKDNAEKVDLIQFFVASKKELESQLDKIKGVLAEKGLLWITYPKGRSKVTTDINRDIIAEYAKTTGLQAVAIISIDAKWSTLRLKKI